MQKIKVVHFVTGGFSGATQVAIDLVLAQQKTSEVESILVLRKKPTTSAQKLTKLVEQGVVVKLINNFSHLTSIFSLWRLCRKLQPDILVAHGFPEHLIGRTAGILAKVPRLIHVEHNSRERYSWFKRWQNRQLAHKTAKCIGVSQAVAKHLIQLGVPTQKVDYIYNGINLANFTGPVVPLTERQQDLIMVARFSRQKDHLTLVKALAILKLQGICPQLNFLGGGKNRYLKATQRLASKLGVTQQINFVGQTTQVGKLLAQHKIALLITHWEGLPLAVLEYMASGCLVVASDVAGCSELIADGENGFLVPDADAEALAATLLRLLSRVDKFNSISTAAVLFAAKFSKEQMAAKYLQLFKELTYAEKTGGKTLVN